MNKPSVTNLTLRWIFGVLLMVGIRLLLEERLPGGVAGGLSIAAFIFVWLPTVPQAAYRRGAPERRVLYSRLALFLVAGVISAVLYPLADAWLRRS